MRTTVTCAPHFLVRSLPVLRGALWIGAACLPVDVPGLGVLAAGVPRSEVTHTGRAVPGSWRPVTCAQGPARCPGEAGTARLAQTNLPVRFRPRGGASRTPKAGTKAKCLLGPRGQWLDSTPKAASSVLPLFYISLSLPYPERIFRLATQVGSERLRGTSPSSGHPF